MFDSSPIDQADKYSKNLLSRNPTTPGQLCQPFIRPNWIETGNLRGVGKEREEARKISRENLSEVEKFNLLREISICVAGNRVDGKPRTSREE
jgi:hypothetical protein